MFYWSINYIICILYINQKRNIPQKASLLDFSKKKNCWNLYWDKNFEFKRTKLYFKGKRNSSTKHNLSKNGPTFIIEDFFFLVNKYFIVIKYMGAN